MMRGCSYWIILSANIRPIILSTEIAEILKVSYF